MSDDTNKLRDALASIAIRASDGTSSDAEKVRDCARIAREALMPKYSFEQIGYELNYTAVGSRYCGNALRVAKDIPGVTDEERALLDRWLTGAVDHKDNRDGFLLQDLAGKIYRMEEK